MSRLVTLKFRLGLEAMVSRLGLEAPMSRLGRFGPRSSSAPQQLYTEQSKKLTAHELKQSFSTKHHNIPKVYKTNV